MRPAREIGPNGEIIYNGASAVPKDRFAGPGAPTGNYSGTGKSQPSLWGRFWGGVKDAVSWVGDVTGLSDGHPGLDYTAGSSSAGMSTPYASGERVTLEEVVVTAARKTREVFNYGLSLYGQAKVQEAYAHDQSGRALTIGYQRFDSRYHITNRAVAALRIGGGIVEGVVGSSLVVTGTATSEFGVGVPIAVGGVILVGHASDVISTGLRDFSTGGASDTLTSRGLQAAGVPRPIANGAETVVSTAATVGASTLTNSMSAAARTSAINSALAAENAAPRLVGTYTPSADLKFGTTLFGDEAHTVAGRMLTEELNARGVPLEAITNRTGAGLRGVDMSVDPIYARQLGFEHIEIKPNTANGLRTLDRQVERWGMDPSSVQPVTYDAHGNIWWGFDF